MRDRDSDRQTETESHCCCSRRDETVLMRMDSWHHNHEDECAETVSQEGFSILVITVNVKYCFLLGMINYIFLLSAEHDRRAKTFASNIYCLRAALFANIRL
jgi:hypothetical protein